MKENPSSVSVAKWILQFSQLTVLIREILLHVQSIARCLLHKLAIVTESQKV